MEEPTNHTYTNIIESSFDNNTVMASCGIAWLRILAKWAGRQVASTSSRAEISTECLFKTIQQGNVSGRFTPWYIYAVTFHNQLTYC